MAFIRTIFALLAVFIVTVSGAIVERNYGVDTTGAANGIYNAYNWKDHLPKNGVQYNHQGDSTQILTKRGV